MFGIQVKMCCAVDIGRTGFHAETLNCMHTGLRGLRACARWTILLAGLFLARDARAILLDWDTYGWVAGSTVNSYDIDPSNPGMDVTITITGSTTRFVSTYPQTTTALTGGTVPPENSVQLFLDFNQDSQTITVTVTFHYAEGVDEVTYDLFDVDRSGTTYIDRVSAITGTEFGTGTPVGPTITG